MDLPWAMDHTSEGVHSSSRAASSSMTLLIRNKKIINCECYYGFCATWMSSRRRKIIEWRPTSYKRSQTGHIFNLKGVSVCIVNQQITHYLLSPLFIYMQTQPWNVTYLVLLAVRQIYDPVSKSMAKLHYNLFCVVDARSIHCNTIEKPSVWEPR